MTDITTTTTTARRSSRRLCSCGKPALYGVAVYNRGSHNRNTNTGVICADCLRKFTLGGVAQTTKKETKGAKLKDVRSCISFVAEGVTPDFAKWLSDKGYVVNHEGRNARAHSVESDKFCRITSHLRNPLQLHLFRDHTVENLSKVRLTLKSPSIGLVKVYEYEREDLRFLDSWARACEHDFCQMIGKPYWSALKTGTRTK